MLSDDYEVEYETTAIQTDEPVLLPAEVPRDQGWCWVVLLASFLTLFITNGVHTSFGILYAALITHFDSGYEETAWIGSISLGLLCFFSPIAGLLIEQIGCRTTSAIGALVCSLGFLLSSFATSIATLYFTHGVLFGLGTSLTYTAAMLVVTRSFETKRNFATGLCASGSQFGGISLAPLSQVLFDRLGYANTFRTFSGLLLLVAISSLAYRPEYVENRTLEISPVKKSPKDMLHVWKNKAYVVWALTTTTVALGYNIPRYTLVKYAIDQDISKDASAWLVSYVCVTSAIGRILFGRFCDWIPALYLCQGSIIFLSFCSILLPFLNSYVALVIVSFISGFPDGGFIASLPTITTQIVGTDRMAEGFGFVLFCQSYSNVMGPPFAGMIYDNYHSYKAVFIFAAAPQIIGLLGMFLIPYYTKNQINYRQEIDLNSTSAILDSDGGPAPSSAGHDGQVPEVIGNYNVIINLPGPVAPTDIRQVNVIIQKTVGNENCIEPSNVIAEITSNFGEEDMIGCQNNTASNATIVASDSLSVINEGIEQKQATKEDLVKVESCHINILNTDIEGERAINTVPGNIADSLQVEPVSKVPDVVAQSDIASIIATPQVPTDTIFDVLSISTEDQHIDECHEIMNVLQNNSGLSVNSSIRTPSNLAFPEERLEPILKLSEEPCLPRLTPPPQGKGHRVHNETPTIDLSEPINLPTAGFPEKFGEENVPSSNEIAFEVPSLTAPLAFEAPSSATPLAFEAPSSTAPLAFEAPSSATPLAFDVPSSTAPLAFESPSSPTPLAFEVPSSTTPLTFEVPTSSAPLAFEVPSSSTPLAFKVPSSSAPLAFTTASMVNEPPSLITSGAMNNTLSLVQDQLPEPLKPTSVCSVWGTTPCDGGTTVVAPSSNLDMTSATSPLSCELSTVIADVIQSLTSQNTAKSKETTAANNTASTSQSRDHLHKHESLQIDKTEENIGDTRGNKDSLGSVRTTVSHVTPRSLIQTSVLNTMQSIVAEGCPEDSSLLEDISIDLSLDKDPSIASIVLIDEHTNAGQHLTSSSCMKINSTYENEIPHIPYRPVEPTIPDTSHQDGTTVNVFNEPTTKTVESTGDPDLTRSIESTNPFYNTTINQPPLNETTERVIPINSTNPFHTSINGLTTADTIDTTPSIESTNPFYQNT